MDSLSSDSNRQPSDARDQPGWHVEARQRRPGRRGRGDDVVRRRGSRQPVAADFAAFVSRGLAGEDVL